MLKSAKSVLSARAVSPRKTKMAPPLGNGLDSRRAMTYSTTALKRWSCQNNGEQLPGGLILYYYDSFHAKELLTPIRMLAAIPEIKAIHVYDFDNTCS